MLMLGGWCRVIPMRLRREHPFVVSVRDVEQGLLDSLDGIATNLRPFEKVTGSVVYLGTQPGAEIGYKFTVFGRVRYRSVVLRQLRPAH